MKSPEDFKKFPEERVSSKEKSKNTVAFSEKIWYNGSDNKDNASDKRNRCLG